MKVLAILLPELRIRYSAQLIIAALNEEHGIGLTIAEMKDTLEEITVLVVDGKSRDRTVEIAKSLGAEVVCQDGFGKGDALAKALEHADLNVDYIVLTDADYTYPAEYVPKMIKSSKKIRLLAWFAATDSQATLTKKRCIAFFTQVTSCLLFSITSLAEYLFKTL